MKKTIKYFGLLLLSPVMVLAAQDNWNIVDGGKIVNGQYQLKCGEGSGWQKCGTEDKYKCVYDANNKIVFGLYLNNNMIYKNPFTAKNPFINVVENGVTSVSLPSSMKSHDSMPYPNANEIEFTSNSSSNDPRSKELFYRTFNSGLQWDFRHIGLKSRSGKTYSIGRIRKVVRDTHKDQIWSFWSERCVLN